MSLAYITFDVFLNVVNHLNSAQFREDVLELGELISSSQILRGANVSDAVDTAYKIARDAAYGFAGMHFEELRLEVVLDLCDHWSPCSHFPSCPPHCLPY